MKKNTYLFIYVCLALLISTLYAQETEDQGNVFAISTWKIRFDQIDDFLKLIEEESKPIYMQNEHIKSMKILTHLWGGDWTVVMISEYESLAEIDAAQKKSAELFEKKYPDKQQRDTINDKRRSMIMGHTDNIVQEVPNLRK